MRILYQKQKQPPRGVPRKRCSENIQQIYRRTPMPKCDFNKVYNFAVNLLHIFRTTFPENTSEGLVLQKAGFCLLNLHRKLFFVQSAEAVVRRCSVEKVFLEILQNSQENTCARLSFLIKLQAYLKDIYLSFTA